MLKALESTGQRENTIVWFLSDNGGPTSKNASRNDPFSGKVFYPLFTRLFSLGINVSFLDFDTGKDVEIGAGPIVGFLGDMVHLSLGWNLNVKNQPKYQKLSFSQKIDTEC